MSSCRTRNGAPAPTPNASRRRCAPTRPTRSRARSWCTTRPPPASPAMWPPRHGRGQASGAALCRRRLLDREHRLPFDDWGVDFAIIGSQKGLMLPAGLGIVCASKKALAAMKDGNCRHAYFDLADQIKANAAGYFPYTPALPMLHGLREALNIEEGLEDVFARHRHLASGARATVEAWGLKLRAKEPKWHSDTVTAIMVPAGFNGADVIDVAYRRYNLALGAGLSQVAGKLFRIGHLGDLNELMLLGAIAGAEMAMRDTGIEVELGSGVAAAQAEFRDCTQAKIKQVAAE